MYIPHKEGITTHPVTICLFLWKFQPILQQARTGGFYKMFWDLVALTKRNQLFLVYNRCNLTNGPNPAQAMQGKT
jgi:hypothetical protein